MRMVHLRWIVSLVVANCVATASTVGAASPLVELRGSDFSGGGKDKFGASFYGEDHTNPVYARPCGAAAILRASFELKSLPSTPVWLYLTARDSSGSSKCKIAITLNDKVLYEGASGFSDKEWQTRHFVVPEGVLKVGVNELTTANNEETGRLGAPPWLLVSHCAVAGGDYVRPLSGSAFIVQIPAEKQALPTPLSADGKPGFAIRGTKGWNWTPEQYLEEIPVLAKYKMNFLMPCYLSLYVRGPLGNEWWQPMPEEMKTAYARVIRSCKEHGIEFCFAKHPHLGAKRPMDPASDEDFEKLWQHYAWAQGQGVKWLCLPLDDVKAKADQFPCANKLFARLRANDPQCQMIFCPSEYWGTGGSDYLKSLAAQLHPEIYCFWTGPGVCSRTITRKKAEGYRNSVKHRLIVWDNYPVNDSRPTLHLGPVTGRDPDLGEVCDGYMANPLYPQNQIGRVPLLTMADYAYNPRGYDPQRSIGQAIVHLAETPEQRLALKELVETYPGFLIFGGGTGMNPPIARFEEALKSPSGQAAAATYLERFTALADRLDHAFPDQFNDAKKTVRANLKTMQDKMKQPATNRN